MPPFSGEHTPIVSLINFSEYPSSDDIRGEISIFHSINLCAMLSANLTNHRKNSHVKIFSAK